jgi:hypothetical protein
MLGSMPPVGGRSQQGKEIKLTPLFVCPLLLSLERWSYYLEKPESIRSLFLFRSFGGFNRLSRNLPPSKTVCNWTAEAYPRRSGRLIGGFPPYIYLKGAKSMKTTIIKLIATIIFLVASGTTPVKADGGGGQPPLCYPKACVPGR